MQVVYSGNVPRDQEGGAGKVKGKREQYEDDYGCRHSEEGHCSCPIGFWCVSELSVQEIKRESIYLLVPISHQSKMSSWTEVNSLVFLDCTRVSANVFPWVFLSLGIKEPCGRKQEMHGTLGGCSQVVLARSGWKPVLELTSKAGTGLLGKASRI